MNCTIHLISLDSSIFNTEIRDILEDNNWMSRCLVRGRAHGWVHPPMINNTSQLLAGDWDLFFVTDKNAEPPKALRSIARAWLSVNVLIPQSQYETLKSMAGSTPTPIPETPTLPSEWSEEGGIPESAISSAPRMHGPGELKLDSAMVNFLSTTLPESVKNQPVSLFNLFKYPNHDSSVHGAYMEGFKEKFGPAAGAAVKFMGPVVDGISSTAGTPGKGRPEGEWHDANLVQYDSIWHYAYMLSTDVYQDLNQQKMAGLADTCILCVSEFELA